MSRGPGITQRFILDYLAKAPPGPAQHGLVVLPLAVPSWWIAEVCHGHEDGYNAPNVYPMPPRSASESQRVSVRRALGSLERQGLVEREVGSGNQSSWRRALTHDEAVLAAERYAKAAVKVAAMVETMPKGGFATPQESQQWRDRERHQRWATHLAERAEHYRERVEASEE